jgi:hypothetical protein
MKMIFQHFFGNFFDNKEITTTRLYNFAKDTLSRFQAQNETNLYDNIIAFLIIPIVNLEDKISRVDVALGLQFGKTLSVDQLIRLFKKTMSDKEGVIADAVGGYDTPKYLEFYPRGLTEYSHANKRDMPFLVDRVHSVATTNASLLNPDLVLKLKAFKSSWDLNRTDQQHQKGEVSEDRGERDVVRMDVEVALLKAMHTLGAMYPANPSHCAAFFDFNLLLPVSKSAKKKMPPMN